MIRILIYTFLCLMPSAFVQAQNVEVNLDVLDVSERDSTNASQPPAFLTVDELREKYSVYPYTHYNPQPGNVSPKPEVKPEVVFVAIPAPDVKPYIKAQAVELVDVEPNANIAVVEEAPVANVSVVADVTSEVVKPEVVKVEVSEPETGKDSGVTEEPVDERGFRVTGIGYNGDDIRINDVVSDALVSSYIPQINAKPDLRVGLYAYASADERGERKARRLSLSRALELRSFLISNGVNAGRIDIFPLGDQASDGFRDRIDIILQL